MFGNQSLPAKPGLNHLTHNFDASTRRCEWCGGSYQPRQDSQRTCSDKCGERRCNSRTAQKKGKVLTQRACARCNQTYLGPSKLCRDCEETPAPVLEAGEACAARARFIEDLLAKMKRPARIVELQRALAAVRTASRKPAARAKARQDLRDAAEEHVEALVDWIMRRMDEQEEGD